MALANKIIKNIAKSRFSRIFNQKEQEDSTKGKADKLNNKEELLIFGYIFQVKNQLRKYCLEDWGLVQLLGNSFLKVPRYVYKKL